VWKTGQHTSIRWLVEAADLQFTIDILVEPAARTVDIVSARDYARGLFARILPNLDGSELLFTLFFDPPRAPRTPA
jgi:hypothetical protein